MNSRHLFLVAYDISDNNRRRQALSAVQTHALGGQKSFYECWLTVGELQSLLLELGQIINKALDRILFVRLDARCQSLQLGQAEAIASTDYFYVA